MAGNQNEETPAEHPDSPGRKQRKKRDATALRKAPQAPKRFKSSYICFFMAKQTEIKDFLGDKATVTEVSKPSAEMWKNLPPEERAHWDDVAAKDKERYMLEKATYTGPWQVPWKRAKKDPSAPKRPMSAFLYFSQGRRSVLKQQNPNMKNTEVSRLLGEMWRSASDEEKRPHVEKEKREREKYKVAIAEWRKEFEAKQEAQRKAHAEHLAMASQALASGEQQGHAHPQPIPYPELHQYGPPGQQPGVPTHPYSLYPGHPYGYPYPTGPYNFPTNGKQPVILGPQGTPHFQPFAGSANAETPAPYAAGTPGFEDGSPDGSTNYEYGDAVGATD